MPKHNYAGRRFILVAGLGWRKDIVSVLLERLNPDEILHVHENHDLVALRTTDIIVVPRTAAAHDAGTARSERLIDQWVRMARGNTLDILWQDQLDQELRDNSALNYYPGLDKIKQPKDTPVIINNPKHYGDW